MHAHAWRMIIACALPLLAIFLLPLVGITSGFAFFILIFLALAAHLFMTAGPHEEHGGRDKHGPH